MTQVTQRYVRNTRTGVIFPFTAALAKHRHCVVLPLDLCAEYERRMAQGHAAVAEMEARLRAADKSGEAVSSSELATELENGAPTPAAAPTQAAGPSVPADFDLDLDLSALGKPELTAIAKKLSFPIPSGTKVAEMRQLLGGFLAEAKASATATDAGEPPADPDDESFLQ